MILARSIKGRVVSLECTVYSNFTIVALLLFITLSGIYIAYHRDCIATAALYRQISTLSGFHITGNCDINFKMVKRSPVWNYFKRGEVDPSRATCNLCKVKVKAGESSTSNLHNHLKVHHRAEYLLIRPTGERTVTSTAPSPAASTPSPIHAAFERNNPYDPRGEKATRLNEAVTYCIAKDAMPFCAVERKGFLHMLRAFDPRYAPPTKGQISKVHIPKLFDITRQRVKAELNDVTFFSGTSDMWSSHGMTPYMGYTVHHIDDEWNLRHHTLGTRFVPEDHDAGTLSTAMCEMLAEWGLDAEKQVCITTDNGANVLKAVRDLEWTQLSCFGHNLHLGITKSFKDDVRVKRALGVAHGIVAQFNYSWKKRRDLAAKQVKDGKRPKTLVSDCRTRWGSTFAMVERIVDNMAYIRDIMGADTKTRHLVPTWQDIEVLEALKKALSPLALLTDIMCGEKYVTVSSLKALYNKLESEVLKPNEDDSELVNDMREAVLAELLTKAEGAADIINKSSFLDPRFKADCLSNQEVGEVKQQLKDEMTPNVPVPAVQEPVVAAPPPAKKQRTLAAFIGSTKPKAATATPLTPRQKATDEIDRYLSTGSIDIEDESGEVNPLDWWKDHCRDFPLLATLAKKYLCIQASSSPSERLFSKAGLVVTPKRTQLNPEKANQLIFLAENL